ncbi:methylenetetrahydrofolate reductase C-terminal domain-containing protein [Candidatus Woesearchaeota archaeon]|nr:methylenetetrahydrofolate reductase C-terminal domain-containing protein [Candidatus Woesearchaeota archaeon]
MIVTKKKSFEEVLELINEYNKIILIGCGDCATLCKTGGEEEVLELKKQLEDKGKSVVYTSVIDTACDQRLVKLEIKKFPKEYDCILSLSCGSGAQAISSLIGKPIFPATDTLYAGVTKRIGDFKKMCLLCGRCIIGEYAGICPITMCSKSLLNGPCGGSDNGKCETDPDKDCAWQLIFDRLKEQKKLHILDSYKEPKEWNIK